MHVRLAFAVMIQVDADVLLIDEVLAVGDAVVPAEVLRRVQPAARRGQTIVLVTHDMGAVRRFCHRAMLMERGAIVELGDPERVGAHYLELNFHRDQRGAAPPSRDGRPRALRRRHGALRADVDRRREDERRSRSRRRAPTSSSRRSSSSTPRSRTRASASRSRTRTASRCSPPTRSGSRSAPACSRPGDRATLTVRSRTCSRPGRYFVTPADRPARLRPRAGRPRTRG